MRECPQCFADVFEEDSGTCPHCGAALVLAAATAKPGDEAAGAEAAVADEQLLHFRRQFEERAIHLPQQALDRAREILTTAETELRRATVLLADMRGFSCPGILPEDLSKMAGHFCKTCTDCILRRGGFVVKLIGDAVLAVFGAPVAFDRDTESAVWAALDIREFCEQSAATGPPMMVSIGLATGTVKSGLVEGPTGKTYDIYGHTVNLAERLQKAAGRNEILVCETTHELTRRWFESEPTPPLSLHNIADDYVAHKILGEKERAPVRRQFDTPFCGREKELAALADFLGRPASGAPRVAHIVGEAGIGKSRLIHEALKAQTGRHVVWWEASPWGTAVLLWPVLQWLRKEMGVTAHASPGFVRQAIHTYLADRLSTDNGNALLLEYVFGIPQAIQAFKGMPPETVQKNLFGLLRQLILHPARNGAGTVLVADDLQWVDPLTTRFLRQLSEWPGQSNLAFVLVYRTGAEAPIEPTPDDLCLDLKPLADRDRQTLLARLVPTEEFLPEIRELVLSRAAGNPLFLEEMTKLVRHVMRNNANLNGEALVNRIIEVIPISLRELIQSRIDRLDGRTRQVLQCASLLGLDFTFSVIEMFEMIRDGLAGHLHSLCALRYLDQQPAPPDMHYFFTHGLFRDVAYSTLLEEQKRTLHAALARRFEQVFADRLHEYYELLAFHFARGADTQKALYYLVRAADRQAGLGAASTALENYTEAIELLRDAPVTPARQVLMARILVRCGRLQRTMGNGPEADEMLAGALECAESAGNERLALEAQLEQAISCVWRGALAEAREALEAVIDQAARLGCSTAEVVALNSLGIIHWQRGEFEDALRVFRQLASRAEESGAAQVQADAFSNAGLIYWRWGQYYQALKAFKRALPLRRHVGDKFGLCATLMNMGIVQEQLGKVKAARRAYENARNLAEKTCYAQGLAALESNLSNIERRAGTLTTALEHATRAVEFARQAEDPRLEAIAEENVGLAHAAFADGEQARAHLLRAREIAHTHGNAEEEVSATLYLLKLQCESDAPRASHLEQINELIQRVQSNFPDLAPRAYAIKAQILEAMDDSNASTAREYLEMACKFACQSGNFFQELQARRDLHRFFERHMIPAEAERCSTRIEEMEKVLNTDVLESC